MASIGLVLKRELGAVARGGSMEAVVVEREKEAALQLEAASSMSSMLIGSQRSAVTAGSSSSSTRARWGRKKRERMVEVKEREKKMTCGSEVNKSFYLFSQPKMISLFDVVCCGPKYSFAMCCGQNQL